MDWDISHLLESWDFQPGQALVRRLKGRDGREKIQLRVDLGVLQMNAEGRPDGRRPFGYNSLFEYYQARLYTYVAAHDGNDEGFVLSARDCAKLQIEALQYHQRYFCLLQLEDFVGVIRDTERNLAVFDFVGKHAECDELSWPLQQFRPQLLMVLTRARASQLLNVEDYKGAIEIIEDGLRELRALFQDQDRGENAEQSGEILSLESWLEDIQSKRPLSPRERLERALSEAVNCEDYERAAQVRDELRNLKE